eukprot:CCRYP_008030-RA/>CCRYP_008030-RA protein AED:0.00 eAED:0.00 QI:656/1/1/1/0/0/2/1959/74
MFLMFAGPQVNVNSAFVEMITSQIRHKSEIERYSTRYHGSNSPIKIILLDKLNAFIGKIQSALLICRHGWKRIT